MKLLISIIIIFSFAMANNTNEKRYGYSYLAIGMQHTANSQIFKTNNGDLKLTSQNISPYYTTATLTRINSRFAFEIYAASTLFANTSNEHLNSDYSNKLELMLTDVAFTLHYKPYNEHDRLTVGFRYTYESLKRYTLLQEDSLTAATLLTAQEQTTNLIENKTAAISLDIGYTYMYKIETGTQGFNYRLGAVIGVPFFSATADTYNQESYSLNSVWGYKAAANSYLGYTLFNGLEIGGYVDFLYQIRLDNISSYTPDGKYIDAQEAKKTMLNYGVMASWSF